MDGGATKQDYDEFEMLLGEIPNATSDNSHSREPYLSGAFPEHDKGSSPSSKFIKLYYSSQTTENRGNMVFYGGLTFSKGSSDQKFQSSGKLDNACSACETPALSVKQDGLNLMDKKSLTLALEELTFNDSPATKPSTTELVKHKNTSPNHTILLSGQNANHSGNSSLELGTIEMSTPSMANTLSGVSFFTPEIEVSPPFTSINGVNQLRGKIAIDQLKDQQPGNLLGAEQWQSYLVNSGATPVSLNMHAYQLVPTAPVPRVEVTAPSYKQPYYLDAQSAAYMCPQHLSRSSMEWQNMEEGFCRMNQQNYHPQQLQNQERFCRMNQQYYHPQQLQNQERFCRLNQQYYHPQQLQNQGPVVHQIPISASIAVRPLTGSTVQPYFEMPLSHQIEQDSQNSYWNYNDIHRGYNQLNLSSIGCGLSQYNPRESCGKIESCGIPYPRKLTSVGSLTCSAKDSMGHQASDRIENQYFPELFLTRLHGVNSLRSLRLDPIITNQSQHFADNSGKLISNSQTCQPLVHSNGYFHLDDQNSQNSSPEIYDLHSSKPVQMKDGSVDEVAGRIYSMAKDQLGCRFLQSKFMEGTPQDVRKIFVEIIDHIVELMTDPFGNYLVQKLLDVCNEDQRMHILHAVTRKAGELIRISCDMHGTRAIQKLIETLKTKDRFMMIVSSLNPGVVPLIKDINGNHVAQSCLQFISPECNEFLFDAAVAHCIELATDRQGCCVLQKCLYHSDGGQKHKLMSEIASNSLILSQDPYGNYVVQYVLDQKVPWVTAVVLDQLEGNYEHLSMQKYSSNVVEKCLILAGEERHVKIIQELSNSPRLLQILQDPYGNYVIQSALRECKGTIRAALVEAIRPHVPVLQSSLYGKKILSRASLRK